MTFPEMVLRIDELIRQYTNDAADVERSQRMPSPLIASVCSEWIRGNVFASVEQCGQNSVLFGIRYGNGPQPSMLPTGLDAMAAEHIGDAFARALNGELVIAEASAGARFATGLTF